MGTAKVIYGSTTGMTEAVAQRVAGELGTTAVSVAAAGDADFAADVLVLASSTWGVGDLQDDWMSQLDAVKGKLAGKKVAVFGLGDSQGFADSFCAAVDTLVNEAKAAGATVLCEGVKLDDTNESDQTDSRLAPLIAAVKAAL